MVFICGKRGFLPEYFLEWPEEAYSGNESGDGSNKAAS
jgi:hypothetical protein